MPSRTVGTVLMIDDNEVLRSAVSKVLRTQGFRVLEADDGRSGVDLFQVHEAAIDVIVLDLNLPRLSGREALTRTATDTARREGYSYHLLQQGHRLDGTWRFASVGIHSKTLPDQANWSTCCRRRAKPDSE